MRGGDIIFISLHSFCPHVHTEQVLNTSRDEQKYAPQCAVHTITPHTYGHLHTHLLISPPSHLTPSHPHPHTSPLSTSFFHPHTSHPPIPLLTPHTLPYPSSHLTIHIIYIHCYCYLATYNIIIFIYNLL